MNPRVQTSKTYTQFPAEYLKLVETACRDTVARGSLKSGEFIAEGRIYPNELLVRLGYCAAGHLRQINAEVSVEYNVAKENVKDLMALAFDCAQAQLEHALQTPFSSLPPLWQEHRFEGRPLFIQFSGINTRLEALADKLLGQWESQDLVKGQHEVEPSLDDIKGMLGLLDDTPPEGETPIN